MDTAPPRSLGEFRIEAILGEGGSGVVYDATWGPRRVALKVMHASLADSERVRQQFLTEAQRLQTIAHPAVVKVLSVGALPDGRPYLAMERLDGQTLAQVLAAGPMDPPRALDLFAELCAAVGTLHEQGLIHRDLKPENVYIVGGVHAVLLDFGIAKELDAPASTTTMDGGVRGTPAYMAPERFFGQPASVATDLYELAVTLYAMLAGRLPWDDLADPEARLSPRPLVELAPGIPEDLDVEIRRALSTRAQNRPASAAALAEAVRAAAGSAAPTKPADTARMRPATGGGDAPAPKATVTAEKKPWFAERHNTTDRGKTPLAWAPTQQAPAPAPAKRRWPIIAGALAVAAVAGGVAWWRIGGTHGEAASVTPAATTTRTPPVVDAEHALAPADDPWGAKPAPKPAEERGALPTSGPEVSVKVATDEMARALPHLPADTTFVVAGLVGQLRRDTRFQTMWDKLDKHPKVQMMLAAIPPCMKTLLAGSEWFAFGAVGFEAGKDGTLIVRGRWQRADVEACFADQSQELKMTDGTRMLQLPEIGWVDFLDANTVYISVRQDLAAAQVHDNVRTGKGMTKRTRALLAPLAADRALVFALDGTADVEWPNDALPKGSDAAGVLQVSEDGIAFDVTLDVKSEDAAKDLEATLRPELEPILGAGKAGNQLVIARTKSQVKIGGKLSNLMMGLVATSIATMQ